ncbi:hypothetical protein [Gemmatimonas sp. UBA7669]|uniref:hypothetical protein n=1 Tax=Gemmatimonas sp. UBA7669 TaxID=1946568 RepID=UPI0025C12DFC|nr:hypothetical protein [Gemmatimonas sp. UBA7669]
MRSRLSRIGLVVLPALLAMPQAVQAQAVMTVDQQLASAVLPLPAEMREGAGVMGYKAAGKLELLRPVKNGMLCLADDPADDRFHVACYADTIDPFMERGRELRRQGVTGAKVDTMRFADIRSGKLKMPEKPAALYQITAPKNAYNVATRTITGGTSSMVVYVPFATGESTGLSTRPSNTSPWLMLPGTPKAHIMFTATM